jgi:transcriptional regulator with XRE-family HTH domain
MESQDDYIETYLERLGKRIKQLRKAKGYKNYEQFAFEHCISRSQYGRYEKGQDIRFTSLCKVLKALDVTFEEFFKDFDVIDNIGMESIN